MLALVAASCGFYPGNMALSFKAGHRDVVRVPHEASMNGPLIDSWTVPPTTHERFLCSSH